MKRAIDFCLALICIIIFSPLFIICYLAIRWEDRGPAFFKQERIGLGGKPFNILKFRSMPTDDNRDEFALFNHNKHENLTRIGRFLRDHHLDELPQLINVLKGDMAFVGPRPEVRKYVDLYTAEQCKVLGVTSYATLHNGYTDTMEKMLVRLEMDLYYLEHRSLLLDAKILLQTFTYIVFGKKF